MAALVLTALSISPVFKDADQSKLKYRDPITKIIVSSRQTRAHKLVIIYLPFNTRRCSRNVNIPY